MEKSGCDVRRELPEHGAPWLQSDTEVFKCVGRQHEMLEREVPTRRQGRTEEGIDGDHVGLNFFNHAPEALVDPDKLGAIPGQQNPDEPAEGVGRPEKGRVPQKSLLELPVYPHSCNGLFEARSVQQVESPWLCAWRALGRVGRSG